MIAMNFECRDSISKSNVAERERVGRELEERSLAGVVERLIRVEHLADPRKESKICQARYLALMRSVPLPRAPGGGDLNLDLGCRLAWRDSVQRCQL